MSILTPRSFYKPWDYPWAYELWSQHESMHWLPQEVPMHEDVKDWNEKLSVSEKNLLTHLFRFFTQQDVAIAEGYNKHFLPVFAHKPELAMMLSSFSARENIHIAAYALLLETLGMPETTYSQFQEYSAMKNKHDFFKQFNTRDIYSLLKTLAVFSAFGEGVQLFGSFVVLLNFSRFNKMKNMGTIIAWSLRDESLHCEGMTTLFKELTKELLKDDVKFLEEDLTPIAYKMVELEVH